jgi:hypothetical protein
VVDIQSGTAIRALCVGGRTRWPGILGLKGLPRFVRAVCHHPESEMSEYQPRTLERIIEILQSQDQNPRSWQAEAASWLQQLRKRIGETEFALNAATNGEYLPHRFDEPLDPNWRA